MAVRPGHPSQQFFDHFVHKGQEAAKTCADTLSKLRAVRRVGEAQKVAS